MASWTAGGGRSRWRCPAGTAGPAGPSRRRRCSSRRRGLAHPPQPSAGGRAAAAVPSQPAVQRPRTAVCRTRTARPAAGALQGCSLGRGTDRAPAFETGCMECPPCWWGRAKASKHTMPGSQFPIRPPAFVLPMFCRGRLAGSCQPRSWRQRQRCRRAMGMRQQRACSGEGWRWWCC